MATLAQLQQQIEKLQREADALRKKEVAEVISRIKDAIQTYGLSAEDLGLSDRPQSRKVAVKVKSKAKALRSGAGVPKYKDPKSGKTWTGYGKPPGWIAKARDRTKFLITQPPAAEAASGETGTSAP